MSERGALSLPPRRYSKLWLAFARTVERTAAGLGGRVFYRRWFLGPGRFRVREEVARVKALPIGLHGFCIVQLSDLHGGRFMGEGDLKHVIAAVLEQRPDVVVLTGDYITSRWQEVLGLMSELRKLEAPYGVFAIFGNHDYRGRNEHRIAELFRDAGIVVLRNQSVRIDTGNGTLGLVGLEDLEEAKLVDELSARAAVRPEDVEVVLCHNPNMAEELARPQCAAVLSGHTHGNQIDLPGFRHLGPEHAGERRQFGATAAITNVGLGVIGLPLRIGAPAEIVRLTLVAESV